VHHLGIPTGERCSEPSLHNPRGYYDDRDFYDVLRILTGTAYLPNAHFESIAGVREMTALITKRNAAHAVWGLSLPLLCVAGHRLLGLFRNPHLLLAVRPFEETVESFMKMSGWPRSVVEHTQSLYYLGLHELMTQAFHLGVPVMAVEKAHLATKPEEAVPKIAHFIFGEVPKTLEAAIGSIDASLHHAYSA